MFPPKGIHKLSMYWKMLIMCVSLTTVALLFLSGFLYKLFSNSAATEIERMSLNSLEQISYTAEIVDQQITELTDQLILNPDVMAALQTQRDDPVMNYHALLALRNLSTSYHYVNDIALYNGLTGRYISSIAADEETNRDLVERIQDNTNNLYSEIYPRTLRQQTLSGYQKTDVLTILLYPGLYRPDSKKHGVIINLNEGYLRRTMYQINRSEDEGNIIILDSQGQVLSHTDTTQFGKDFSRQDYVQQIAYSIYSSGSYTMDVNGVRTLISYVKTPDLGWTFISTKPYGVLLSNITSLRNTVTIVTALILLVEAAVALLMVRRLYNPIRSLVLKLRGTLDGNDSMDRKRDEIQYLTGAFNCLNTRKEALEFSLNETALLLQDAFYGSILRGDGKQAEAVGKVVCNIGNLLEGRFYCVVICRIDHPEQIDEQLRQRELALCEFAICNVGCELLEPFGQCAGFHYSETDAALLIKLTDNILPIGFREALLRIREVVSEALQISISIGIGEVATAQEDIHLSCQSALECLSYRMQMGYGCIVDEQLCKQQFSDQVNYPFGLEKKLMETIHMGDQKAAQAIVGQFLEGVRAASYTNCMRYCNQLLSILAKHYAAMPLSNKEDPRFLYQDLLQEMERQEVLDDIGVVISSLVAEIGEVSQLQNTRKSDGMVVRVQEYIREQYADFNLSLESAAEQVGLSAGYLGKLFKLQTGENFSDYLNRYRVEQAQERLIQTDFSVSRIAEEVGILNSTYFFTLFKRLNGLTPTQYRKEHWTTMVPK